MNKDKLAKRIGKDIQEIYKQANSEIENVLNRQRLDSIRVEYERSFNIPDTTFEVKGSDGVWKPKDAAEAVNDMLDDEIVLLMFSNLKQYYGNHQNAEFTAISIYSLCKYSNELNFFIDPYSKEELEQLMREVDKLIENAKTETDRKYFKMALYQLDQIKKKQM